MLVWSEFGRRAQENGSGTDHGAAGCGFLIGARAAGRMVGEFPGLSQLDKDGNLRATADYRGVYGALCGDWFGVDPARGPAGRARHRPAGDGQVIALAARRSPSPRPPQPRAVARARRGDRVPLHALAHDGQARAGDRPARDPRRGPARPAARPGGQGALVARAGGRAGDAAGRASPSGAASSRKGKWTLYCSLPGHKKAGMRATLTVK